MVKASHRRAYELRGGAYHEPVTNRILAALPEGEYKYLSPHLEFAALRFKQALYEPSMPMQFGYFPNSGMICLIAVMRDGASVEVGVIGNEGFVGTPILLGVKATPNRALVQVSGTSLRINAEALAAILPRTPRLELMLRRFIQAQIFQLAQLAACNRFHEVEERLARWLLMARDRAGSGVLPLTHEFLAEMLGTRRSTVTVAAGALQRAGLIDYGRGRVRILDRTGLENIACECYKVTKQQLERFVFAPR
jgi:CRP-like cAMP-binding protein